MGYFGTDGIRKKANFFTTDFIDRFAGALYASFGKGNYVIARDPRISGNQIEKDLVKSLGDLGVHVTVIGMTATPILSFYVRKYRALVGIMISASHNPADDNGLKLFDKNGYKITTEQEKEIERNIANCYSEKCREGSVCFCNSANAEYIAYLKDKIKPQLAGKAVAIDAANGATAEVARQLFNELNCKVRIIYDDVSGREINKNCGAMHPETLKEFMDKEKLQIGFSFDGDGDRVVAYVDGKMLDGDCILEILAKDMIAEKTLIGNRVVGTVMTNLGLEDMFKNIGITLERVAVGDKNIIELMKKEGYTLGGEQSGHIVNSIYQNTGDGILIALLLACLYYEGKIDSKKLFTQYPQILTAIRLPENQGAKKIDYDSLISKEECKTKGLHVVVRESGTEPVVRIMVQGKDIQLVKLTSEQLNEKIQGELNG